MEENNTEELERYNYIYHFGSKIIKKWIDVSELRFGQTMSNFERWLKINKYFLHRGRRLSYIFY